MYLLYFAVKFTTKNLHASDLSQNKIQDEGTLVTKEYIKGSKNVYSHPAITDYNKTTDSANKTVSTLIRIIATLRNKYEDGEEDPLLTILNGGGI